MTDRIHMIATNATLTQRERDAAYARARNLRSAEATKVFAALGTALVSAFWTGVEALHRPTGATGRG